MEPFFVYMLRCADDSFYVGHTDALEKRIAEHHSGELGGYTFERRPVTVVHVSTFFTREEALVAERKLKGWSRAKKEALIGNDWARVRELARCRAFHGEPTPRAP